MDIRQEKIESNIKDLAASYFGKEAGRISMLTVTGTHMSPDMKKCDIFITVLPVDQESNALNFAKRHRKELREYIEKHLKIRKVPFLDVFIDKGEKARQRIDQLLKSE